MRVHSVLPAPRDHRRWPSDDAMQADTGVALLAVLLVGVLIVGIGAAIALVADTDTAIASAHRDTVVGRHTAEATVAFLVHELAQMPDWTPVLRGVSTSALRGGLVPPAAAGGRPVDLTSLTMTLQAATYGGDGWGANTPRWGVLAWGVPGRDLPFAGLSTQVLVVAWVADDSSETDGDPATDTNDTLLVWVRAIGPSLAQVDVRVVIHRVEPGIVIPVSWRVLA